MNVKNKIKEVHDQHTQVYTLETDRKGKKKCYNAISQIISKSEPLGL